MVEMLTTEEVMKKFMLKVKVVNDCWEWQGAKLSFGYGSFWMNGKGWSAHRASWILHGNNIPDGAFVCHHCDNPPCCNPDHLFLGDAMANMRDKIKKGRAKYNTDAAHQWWRNKTHCVRGHPLSGDNVYIRKDKYCRQCKKCSILRQNKRYLKEARAKLPRPEERIRYLECWVSDEERAIKAWNTRSKGKDHD